MTGVGTELPDGARGVSDYEFTCPTCGATYLVDEGARRLLTRDGCAVCGTVPSAAAFAPADAADDGP